MQCKCDVLPVNWGDVQDREARWGIFAREERLFPLLTPFMALDLYNLDCLCGCRNLPHLDTCLYPIGAIGDAEVRLGKASVTRRMLHGTWAGSGREVAFNSCFFLLPRCSVPRPSSQRASLSPH